MLLSILFALLYKVMPNTEVNWRAALMGGLVGGSLWLMLNILNAVNLSRVVGMSKIYGTALGIIPIFLIGFIFLADHALRRASRVRVSKSRSLPPGKEG
jgi:membrane protein